ncbi:MAG TPA: 5'-methylthioadenosine/adenosylhomocysteine nucleosidase [Puia sp.]|jgi:adenosylhomocysteine nucleosidase|nr:5'-methylthioadenosine/adenosylhomocysteine nucleosidase [Puia sp.]
MEKDRSGKMIGIMGAMPEEINGVVELLTERRAVTRGMRTYHLGRLNGISTVVVFSRWGKVAAATTVMNLILEFNISELLFTGVAGAMEADLKVGDIVIAKRLIQHDMDARPLMPQFEIPLLGMTYFESPESRITPALAAVQELLEKRHLHQVISEAELDHFGIMHPKVVVGEIASGDHFFSHSDDKRRLQRLLPDVLCVEMEGASVAQVCHEYDIPFTIVRTISDEADDHSGMDFQAFVREIASKYSVEIIKNIYASIR